MSGVQFQDSNVNNLKKLTTEKTANLQSKVFCNKKAIFFAINNRTSKLFLEVRQLIHWDAMTYDTRISQQLLILSYRHENKALQKK